MPRYRVGLTQTIVEETTVWVKADSAQEAEQAAIALCKTDPLKVEWDFLQSFDGPEIASVDEDPE